MTLDSKDVINTDEKAKVPLEIDSWNWTAFYAGVNWAIRNKLPARKIWISAIPFIGPYIIASKGNRWAWQNGEWEAPEQFHKVQKEQSSDLVKFYWISFGAPIIILLALVPIVFLIKACS